MCYETLTHYQVMNGKVFSLFNLIIAVDSPLKDKL